MNPSDSRSLGGKKRLLALVHLAADVRREPLLLRGPTPIPSRGGQPHLLHVSLARHTAATLLLQQGVDARVVMEILGHSQISLTQNTYQHVVPVLARDAADKMAKALWE